MVNSLCNQVTSFDEHYLHQAVKKVRSDIKLTQLEILGGDQELVC